MPHKTWDGPRKIRHGTNAGYSIGKCRCKWCAMAHRAYHGADMSQRHGHVLPVIGGEPLSERISVELPLDELIDWDLGAAAAGLSRQAYVRRCVKEVRDVEKANERNRERELQSPMLEN